MIIFQDWIEIPFSKAHQKPEAAINLAELYWQGSDPNFLKSNSLISFAKI